jgi:hypothetical protein
LASFQKSGASAAAFSSARRSTDASKSKMPPQQPDRLLNLGDNRLDLRTHDTDSSTVTPLPASGEREGPVARSAMGG